MSPHTDPGALLPCPFCGAPAAMSFLLDDDDAPQNGDIISAWVACPCGVEIHESRTEKEAAAKWNARQAASQGSAGGNLVGYVSPATLTALNDPYGAGPVVACAGYDTTIPLYVGAAQACTSRQRTALQKCSGALGTMPWNLKIAFTGEWAHLGTATISEILDEADAALSVPSASRGIEA